MHTARDIADYFLAINPESESGEGISNLKMQKLVYYAQGFHLAMFDKPLFEEKIEAWMHGPVIPVLYHEFKKHGDNPIPLPKNFNLKKFSEEEQELLDEVYKIYGQFSGWRLRQLTHEEAPWKNAYRGPFKNNDNTISHKSLKEFFVGELQNG